VLEVSAVKQSLVDAFFSSLNAKTKVNYQADLKDFTEFLKLRDVEDAAKTFIGYGPGQANAIALEYKISLKERALAPKTINRRLAALKSLVKFCNLVGLITWRLSVQGEKVLRYKDTRGMSVEVLGEMLDKSSENRNETKALRDVAIIRLFSDLGLRREEVASLDFPRDVDLSHNELLVLGKGQTERQRLSMAADTAKALKAWLEVRGDFEGALFTSLSNNQPENSRISLRGMTYLVTQSAKAIGVKSSPHKLRHTAITEAAIQIQKAGMPLEELLDFSRHKDIRTALIYRDQIENRQGAISSMVAEQVTKATRDRA
jgi:integrase/recombinase XerC